MNPSLTDLEKALLTTLQDPLPICRRPFAEVAARLDEDEETVVDVTRDMWTQGLIRRFRAQIDYRALGRIAVLVAASASAERLDDTIERINALPGVSHHYLRDHEFNLWFTLQGAGIEAIDGVLSRLAVECGVAFHVMPAVRFFKLDVRFRLTNNAPPPAPSAATSLTPALAELTLPEKKVLPRVQTDLPIVAEPFDVVAGADLSVVEVLKALHSLTEKGVLRRIAAVLNHHKLGYSAAAMFCATVEPSRIIGAGSALAALPEVSHCYERRPFVGFEHNLFGMIHARSSGEIRNLIQRFTMTNGIDRFDLLATIRELKKEPVRVEADDLV